MTMKIELKLELDTEQEKDELLLSRLVELLENYQVEIYDEEVDKT